jgi:hypothetical protein
MKLRIVILTLVAFIALIGFTLLAPGTASAQTRVASTQMTDDCGQAPTIDSLETCVQHAADHGFITSKRVVRSLLVKLDAAGEALEDSHTSQAIHLLRAFIHEVKAQSGKHIDPMHAEHMVMHAQKVIDALKQK